MDCDTLLLVSIICGAATLLLPRTRRWWVRPWLKRAKGNLELINYELNEDPERYKSFLRMDKETFEDLLTRLGAKITKQETFYRNPISARDRLIIALRFLATGESIFFYRTLGVVFNILLISIIYYLSAL